MKSFANVKLNKDQAAIAYLSLLFYNDNNKIGFYDDFDFNKKDTVISVLDIDGSISLHNFDGEYVLKMNFEKYLLCSTNTRVGYLFNSLVQRYPDWFLNETISASEKEWWKIA